ncbi:low-density lipoprotein receptor-related protein 2-like [Branchiostoma lanceolatum]|uniref:low-density lipoprotein receptor-related protein 2-like n=1 Tax=Branchiostoma lanceolatum TaxID=7740 RepID=UPI00345366D0
MDGTNHSTIISNLTDPHMVTIDYNDNRLYYCDDYSIYSSDLFGNNRRVHFSEEGSRILGVAVDYNYIYWISSTRTTRQVGLISKFKKTPMILYDGLQSPFDISVSTASTALTAKITNGCPTGYDQHGDGCFKVYYVRSPYNRARELCAAEWGSLAMPKNSYVDNFLLKLDNADQTTPLWFGLTKQQGDWRWEDGTPHDPDVDWNNWKQGELVESQRQQSCALYDRLQNSWVEELCSSGQNFICQLTRDVVCPLGFHHCGHKYTCFESWKRCDGNQDCSDNSDEDGCDCVPIPEFFQQDDRLAILPNLLGHRTFDEIKNSSVVDLLNSSLSIPGEYHPELAEFTSTIIFPRCLLADPNCPSLLSAANTDDTTAEKTPDKTSDKTTADETTPDAITSCT